MRIGHRSILLMLMIAPLCMHTGGQHSEDELSVRFLEPLPDEMFENTRSVDVSIVADQHKGMEGRFLALKVFGRILTSFSLPDSEYSEHTVKLTELENGPYTMSIELDGGTLASTAFSIDNSAELLRVEDDVEEESEDGTDYDPPIHDPTCEAQNLTRRRKQPKVFDTFTFNGEIDLLEVRLEELDSVVDVFVIVEGSKTFQNQPKELKLMKFSERLSRFMPKIEYVVEDFSRIPADGSAWLKEFTQRNAIVRGLDQAAPSDLVIVSDLDEIPKRDAVLVLQRCAGYLVPAFLESQMHYYGFQFEFAERWWQGPKVLLRDMLTSLVSASMVRSIPPLGRHGTIFRDAAWHCSFFVDVVTGSVEPLSNKFKSYSHTEWLDRNASKIEYIRKMVDEGRDLFEEHYGNRSGGLHRVPSANCTNLPVAVLQNLRRYQHWAPHCISSRLEDGAGVSDEGSPSVDRPPTVGYEGEPSSESDFKLHRGPEVAERGEGQAGKASAQHSFVEVLGRVVFSG